MLPFALVGLGSVAERTVEDQAVGSAHRQLGKKNKNQVCVPNWSQCDSPASYSGSTTCCDGADLLTTYSCQSLTPTYSQCKPHVVPPPAPPSPPPASSPPPFVTAPQTAHCSLDTMAAARTLVSERKKTLQHVGSKFGSLLDSKNLATEWENFVHMIP